MRITSKAADGSSGSERKKAGGVMGWWGVGPGDQKFAGKGLAVSGFGFLLDDL